MGSGGDEPACVAAVVLMQNVRDDDFLDRFVRHRLDLRYQLVVKVFAQVLGVDQNNAVLFVTRTVLLPPAPVTT